MAFVITIALGLASRRFPALFPAALGKYPGDALWSLMVYWGIAWLIPRASIRKVALLALLASYADEFSQLYQAPWLNAIRATPVGHLILGSVFSWLDMLAYAVGVGAGAAIECCLQFNPPRNRPVIQSEAAGNRSAGRLKTGDTAD